MIKNSLKDIYIEDKTPNGKIVMYNFDNNIFNYYCNNKNAISYHELEAVATIQLKMTVEYYLKNNQTRTTRQEQPIQEQPDKNNQSKNNQSKNNQKKKKSFCYS